MNDNLLKSMIEHFNLVVKPKGRFISQGAVAYNSEINCSIFNPIFACSNESINDIDEIEKFYNLLPFEWIVAEEFDVLTNKLLARLYKKQYSMLGMELTFEKLSKPTVSKFRVEMVQNESQFSSWLSIMTEVLGMPPNTLITDLFSRCYRKDMQSFLYLGYVEDKPVSTSLIFVQGVLSSLYCVATLPDYRRRGIAYEVCHTALNQAKKMDCYSAFLFSSAEGAELYRKLGFVESGTYHVISKVEKSI
ncbi:MAG: putative acetyltransferase [Chlamydiales bacterium]|nr:putative acetyltransferase [Chlamydiales bacterium]